MPQKKSTKSPLIARDRPGVGRDAPERAAALAQLGDQQRRARAGPRGGHERLDRRGRQRLDQRAAGDVGQRLLGVLVQAHERGAGTVANVSSSGPSARSGSISAGILRRAVDHHDLAAAQERRQRRVRRQLHDPQRGRHAVGRVLRPRRPGREHALGLGPVPEHEAGVDLAQRVELELERGDDAEVAAAAAQRPEQLGIVVRVRADQLAVGGHQLDRGDAVGLQAVAAGEPAHAAAERVAGDADGRRRAVQRDEAVRGGGVDDLLPEHAGAGAAALADRVDLDAAEAASCGSARSARASRAGRRCGRSTAPATRRPRERAQRTTSATSWRVAGEGDGRGTLVDEQG